MSSSARTRFASRAALLSVGTLVVTGCTGWNPPSGPAAAVMHRDRGTLVTQAPQEAAYQGRQIIRTAWIRLEVDDPAPIAQEVADLAKSFGGHVENRSDSDRRSTLNLRVPAANLDEILDRLSELGDEQERSVSAEDVTEQLADIEASLKNARALRDRLRSLLDRATHVEEILKIETELSRVQTQIDKMEGRLTRLRSQVALSSITVTLERRRILGPVGYVLDRTFWALRKLFVLRD